jgi:AraC-like DNA-binding protein
VHPRCAASERLDDFFGCRIDFGSELDHVLFSPETAHTPFIKSDPYLHDLLVGYCEEALKHRPRPVHPLRTRVENAVTALLPRGKAKTGEVARSLGLSQRTLARRLAAEGLTFVSILNELRSNLARYYLNDTNLSVSEIAWVLGFTEASAFTHAFKRWTGLSPSQARVQASGRLRS